MLLSTPFFLTWYLILCNDLTLASSDTMTFLQRDGNDQKKEHLLHALHRIHPTGRNRPTAEEMAGSRADERLAKQGSLRASTDPRNLQVSDSVCQQVLDGYLGTTGVERSACQTCRGDPNDPAQYIITCDFTDYCSFCAHDDPAGADACYTLTHEYTVRPWNGEFEWIEDVAYSACGIYHDTGRKACLDETYVDWGVLNTRCISVDDTSCRVCEESKNCEGGNYYFYDCGNIEAGLVMDDCDYSINDDIGKDSVFVGFNYGLYAEDTDTCFDDSKAYLGNMGGTSFPVASQTDSPTPSPTPPPTDPFTDIPTESPTPSPTPPPTPSPTPSPTDSPTDIPTDSPTASPTDPSTDTPTDSPTPSPTLSPTASPTALPTGSPTDLLEVSRSDILVDQPGTPINTTLTRSTGSDLLKSKFRLFSTTALLLLLTVNVI